MKRRIYKKLQEWKNTSNGKTALLIDGARRVGKSYIAVSLSIEPSDLDLNPFDRKGGLGRFYEVFGENYEAILKEMNIELVA